MATVQSGYGNIRLYLNGASCHWPIATTLTGASAGPFVLKGSIDETDCGLVPLSKAGGWVRLTGTNENGYGAALGVNVGFRPVLNGPLVFEVRCEEQVLTARSLFIGFNSAFADDVVEPLTSTGTTLTPVATSYAGFWFDSQLTAATAVHYVYQGGTTTCPTLSTSQETGGVLAGAVSRVFRVEIDSNGTVRWYIDGVKEAEVEGALSTTTLLAAFIGTFGTTTTISDVDVNYVAFEASNDWTA